MSATDEKRVLVTGAAGSIGQLVVYHLARGGWAVHAVDRREGAFWPTGVTFHGCDISKRGFVDVLRRHRPRAVVHLARIRSFRVDPAERHRVNFEGTVRVMETALRLGVPKVVFTSRHTVYGALPDQPQFVSEDHPPAAGRTFPEIQDLVAADLYCCGLLWRHQETDVVVLRPVNLVGPTVRTLLARYLSRRRIFTIMGFDPMYQLIHERDFARAIEHSLRPGLRGVFNVTGPGEVPLQVLIRHTGATRVPVPESLVPVLKGRLGFPAIPQGAVDFLKYPCTVDGRRFAEATGYLPAFDLRTTLRSVAS